jgi:hypothetical protein
MSSAEARVNRRFGHQVGEKFPQGGVTQRAGFRFVGRFDQHITAERGDPIEAFHGLVLSVKKHSTGPCEPGFPRNIQRNSQTFFPDFSGFR